MLEGTLLRGSGFTALLPAGAQWYPNAATSGGILIPAGSYFSSGMPASVTVIPMHASYLQRLIHDLYAMDSPQFAEGIVRRLDLMSVHNIGPARSVSLCGGLGHIRDFDCLGFGHTPYRVILAVASVGIHVLTFNIGIKVERWAEFLIPCLSFVASINIASDAPLSMATLQAIIDPKKKDQVEFRVLTPDRTAVPITAMPIYVGKMEVFNVDNSIRTGNIEGVGIAIGTHSLASLT